MTLYDSQIRDIVRRHIESEKRILTWRGWRKVKILNKTAALYDICAAFAREFEEQQRYLDKELARMRAEIEAAPKSNNADLRKAAPGYVFEELRVLFQELEKSLSQSDNPLPKNTTDVLHQIQTILEQDQDEKLRIVKKAAEGTQEEMEQLRRRLVRMAKDLHFSESEVARLRNELDTAYETGGSVASVYKTVQGISNTDKNASAKRDVLGKLFDANKELREKLNK